MKMWLVGAGYWGRKLLDSLAKFDVKAQVIDIRNGQTIDDITDLAPVMLATPLWQHHDQACELLRRGHDVYVEKPMAETFEQVLEIGSYVQPGQILMVGHLFVHHPQLDQIRDIIAAEIIGSVQHVTSRRLNWGIYQTRTDPILSLATHDITIVQAIAGDPPHPTQAQSWHHTNPVQPDRVWFSGHCNDRITFDIDVSWYWPVRTRQTVILGSEGQIVWDQDANIITVSQHQIVDQRAVTDSQPEIITYDHELSPLEAELAHWINCVRYRQEPATGLDSAKMVARAIDRATTLSRRNAW